MIVDRTTKKLTQDSIWTWGAVGVIMVCDYSGCDKEEPDPGTIWPHDYLNNMLKCGYTREPSEWHTEIFHNFCPDHVNSRCVSYTFNPGREGRGVYQCDQCPWWTMGGSPSLAETVGPIQSEVYWDRHAILEIEHHLAGATKRVWWRNAQLHAWASARKFPEQEDIDATNPYTASVNLC